MPRLHRSSPAEPGWTRRRRGRGFTYSDADGSALRAEQVERVKALVIPPAWRDVWICASSTGHLQAVGTDDAGRRQYLYHPHWRLRRDTQKFDRMLVVGARLPRARKRIRRDLVRDECDLRWACAAAVRLIDLGSFRIGSDVYAENGSFGLTTILRRHVHGADGILTFEFPGKSGVDHHVEIDDEAVVAALMLMRQRRGGRQLLAHRRDDCWVKLSAPAVNEYLHEVVSDEFSAKDFRTWHATVLAARAVAADGASATTKTAMDRVVREAVKDVAAYLGNTPTVARSSYIDPRVFELFRDGHTIDPDADRGRRSWDTRQAAVEAEVLALLTDR